jgi:hypothetical protein
MREHSAASLSKCVRGSGSDDVFSHAPLPIRRLTHLMLPTPPQARITVVDLAKTSTASIGDCAVVQSLDVGSVPAPGAKVQQTLHELAVDEVRGAVYGAVVDGVWPDSTYRFVAEA